MLSARNLACAAPRPHLFSAFVRRASTMPKPPVLEKPARFNPPSHASRLPRKPRAYPGPQLSAEEIEIQRRKRYPHTMPPKGTWAYWILMTKELHAVIALVVLISLAFLVMMQQFVRNTQFYDLLPAKEDYKAHPIDALWRAMQVWKLDKLTTSVDVAELRERMVDDCYRRKQYRKAHGLEKKLPFGLGTLEDEIEEQEAAAAAAAAAAATKQASESASSGVKAVDEGKQDSSYRDFEGRHRPVKKWLGIW